MSLAQNRELQIMRKLDHCNIVRLRYFFYSSGEKVSTGVVGYFMLQIHPSLSPCILIRKPVESVVCTGSFVHGKSTFSL